LIGAALVGPTASDVAAQGATITCHDTGLRHPKSGRIIWDVTVTTPNGRTDSYLSLKCPAAAS
jgi:hypothetical protein